ncbi:MAG: site-2 protease family protein [Polyangiaceae bacterium]
MDETAGFDVRSFVQRLALTLIPMILSLSVHEFAHAFSATRYGDSTAKDQGRLTLNPVAHVDPVGTLLLPFLVILSGSGIAYIAWAKPVPFRPDRMRDGVNRRWASAVVSAAGPLSNLVLALLSVGILSALVHAGVVPMPTSFDPTANMRPGSSGVTVLLLAMFTLNVSLAFFNLLPIPPLDGHRLLPPVFDVFVRPLQKYGFAILLGVFVLFPAAANAMFYRPLGATLRFLLHSFGLGH